GAVAEDQLLGGGDLGERELSGRREGEVRVGPGRLGRGLSRPALPGHAEHPAGGGGAVAEASEGSDAVPGGGGAGEPEAGEKRDPVVVRGRPEGGGAVARDGRGERGVRGEHCPLRGDARDEGRGPDTRRLDADPRLRPPRELIRLPTPTRDAFQPAFAGV